MFNNILIGLGILFGSILIIENSLVGGNGYFFLYTGVNLGFIIFISILIGFGMGYGIKGIMNNKNNVEEDDEFNF